MTRGFAAGNTTPGKWCAASQRIGRVSHGSPVERPPNSSITVGRVYPDPFATGSYAINTFLSTPVENSP